MVPSKDEGYCNTQLAMCVFRLFAGGDDLCCSFLGIDRNIFVGRVLFFWIKAYKDIPGVLCCGMFGSLSKSETGPLCAAPGEEILEDGLLGPIVHDIQSLQTGWGMKCRVFVILNER